MAPQQPHSHHIKATRTSFTSPLQNSLRIFQSKNNFFFFFWLACCIKGSEQGSVSRNHYHKTSFLATLLSWIISFRGKPLMAAVAGSNIVAFKSAAASAKFGDRKIPQFRQWSPVQVKALPRPSVELKRRWNSSFASSGTVSSCSRFQFIVLLCYLEQNLHSF